MSIVQVLIDTLALPASENINSMREITNQLLNEYRSVYNPQVTIDRFVDGNIMTFANQIDALPIMTDVDQAFPGLKEYVYYHVIEGIGYWDDWHYCSWVATGLLRYFGRDNMSPIEQHQDAMG